MVVKQGSICLESICPGQSGQDSISPPHQRTHFPAEAELVPCSQAPSWPVLLCWDSRAPKSKNEARGQPGCAIPSEELPGREGQQGRAREASWFLAKRADLQCLLFRASVKALLFFRPTNVSSILPQGKAYYR